MGAGDAEQAGQADAAHPVPPRPPVEEELRERAVPREPVGRGAEREAGQVGVVAGAQHRARGVDHGPGAVPDDAVGAQERARWVSARRRS